MESAPDALRALLTQMVNLLMGAELDELCGAGYGERSHERVNSRNGYRTRLWDTYSGTAADDSIPSAFTDRRRRPGQH